MDSLPPSAATAPANHDAHHLHRPHPLALTTPPKILTAPAPALASELDAAAYEQRVQRGSKGSNRSRAHDSVISHPGPLSPTTPSPPSPASSISSAQHHRSKRNSHISRNSQRPSNDVARPPRAHLDPEKGYASPHRSRSPTHISASNPEVTAVVYDSGEYREKGPEDKPLQLLIFLSLPCALLSFAITLWTLLAILITLLLQPLRLFSTRPSLSTQLTSLLAPPLNLQLHLIYSCSASTTYRPAMLVIVHLFAPFVALGVAIGAWTAACFWFFSMILGDPAGQDGHNDGKESILGVRNWWDRWLSRGLREER